MSQCPELIESRLTRPEDKDSVRGGLLNIINFTLRDFYPEVFLQRPAIAKATLDIFLHNPDTKVRLLAAKCLSILCKKLRDRVKFLSTYICEKKSGEMIFEPSSMGHSSLMSASGLATISIYFSLLLVKKCH